MKTLLLNLPNRVKIQRRYMCSYNAGSMLFPPQELVALGGILKTIDGCDYRLVDCMADEIDSEQLAEVIENYKPDNIVTIQGFECFEEDMYEIQLIKDKFPDLRVILFGHYATIFFDEILNKTPVDIVMLGEPDLIFKDVIKALLHKQPLIDIEGIAYKENGTVIHNPGQNRIKHPEELPMPAYELLHAEKYFEPFMPRPLGLIQSARGCPYSCNYCVRSFGKKLTYRTPDQIIEEIHYLKRTLGIKSLRFIDDTFTVHTKRVMEICEKMIAQHMDIKWTCLSRLDTLKEELIPLMKQAGCERIYFGVESGSPKVLKYLNKELDLDKAVDLIKICRKHGIETLGWFIVGAPNEDEEAFEESVRFAIAANFDYISVSELTIYPGTALYEQLKNDIDFSLLPYTNQWKDKAKAEINKKREREFYRRFYFRGAYAISTSKRVLKHPLEYLKNVVKLAAFLSNPPKQQRADYF